MFARDAVANTTTLTIDTTEFTVNGTDPAWSNATKFTLGAEWDSSSNVNDFFDGSLDDVRIYSRPLTTADTGELYALKVTAVPEPRSFGIIVSGGLTGLVGLAYRRRRRQQVM